MESDNVYIKHILDAISEIEAYTSQFTPEMFKKNKLVQNGVIRELEVIGEASKNLSPSFKTSHKQIPWKEVTGMRDKLIHGYFSVDLEIVWNTVKDKLPLLKEQLAKLKK